MPRVMHSILRGSIAVAALFLATFLAADGASEPASAADRVGFPRDYRAKFQVIRRTNVPNKTQVGTVYANAEAASVSELAQLPYPNGSVIVFEWADTLKAADGTPEKGSDGVWRKGPITRVDVMRREAGFGELYGDARATEWEFASYFPDGRAMKAGAETMSCAKCHRGAAVRDSVFRGRFPELEKK